MTPTTFTGKDGSASLTMTFMRPTWLEVDPSHFQIPGQIDFVVRVLPPTTAPDQAIKDALEPLGGIEDGAITDNPDLIAGQPTRTATLKAKAGDLDVVADVYAFSTPAATYLIEFVAMPAVGDAGRGIYPQLLTTVTVDPAP
jgi:hypothetical protein